MPYKDPARKRERRRIRERSKRKTDRRLGVTSLASGFKYVNPNDLPDACDYEPRVMRFTYGR